MTDQHTGFDGMAEFESGAWEPVTARDELREPGHRGNAMSALLLGASMVRKGGWIKGAPTHVFAELLQELESRGWYLIHEVELTKLRAEGPEPSEAEVEAAAKAINDELRRKGETFSLPPRLSLGRAALLAARAVKEHK